MQLHIREESKKDYPAVFNVIKQAFQNESLSDQTEPFLVERLRLSSAFIPELSLVAEFSDAIIGHIIMTEIKVEETFQEGINSNTILALAPISVLPHFQNKGVGSQLINYAHNVATGLGYRAVALIGHEKYYPRFGYKQAKDFQIEFPFEAPAVNCMVKELCKEGLNGITGRIVYSKAFYG